MRTALLALCALALAACGEGTPMDPAGTPNDPNPQQTATQPLGAYKSWRERENWVTSPLGNSYLTYVFEYVFRSFGANGYVYTGDPVPDLGSKVCVAGESGCKPFSVANGKITIGTESPKTLERTSSGWKIGSDYFTAIPAYDGLTLDGSYKSTTCTLALCSRALITFTPDGRYTTSNHNTYANTLGSTFVGASGGSDSGGTYQIAGQHIDITSSAGKQSRLFFFRELYTRQDGTVSDTLQLADTWFQKE